MNDNKERCNFKTSVEKIVNYKYKERVILIYLYKKYKGNYFKVYDALYNGEKIDTDYTSSTGSLTTGAKVYYVLDEEQTEKVDTTNILKKVKLNGSVSANTNLSPYKIEFIVL